MVSKVTTELTVDRAAVAAVLGCSENHINKLVSRGMPRAARGRYHLPDCVQWVVRDLTNRGAIDPDEVPAIVEARRQLYEAQTRHKTLESERLAGELLDAQDVRQAFTTLAQSLVSHLEGLPTRAARAAAAAATVGEVVTVLRGECNELREQLADHCQALEREFLGGGPGAAPSADAHGGAVGRRGENGAAREPAPGPVA